MLDQNVACSLAQIYMATQKYLVVFAQALGNSLDKLRRPRYDAYSAEQVLLNKQQIWCGRAYPDRYQAL